MSAVPGRPGERDSRLEARYHEILADYNMPPAALRHLDADLSELGRFRSAGEAERWLAEHHRDRTGFAGFPNAYWRRLLDDLLALWERDEQAPIHGARIFIGQVPDQRLNAGTLACGEGRFLILVNHGLARFLSLTARIVVAGMGETLDRPLTRDHADRARLRALMEANYAVLFGEEENLFLEMASGGGLLAVIGATYALEQAVLAHELGHVLASLAGEGRSRPSPHPHLGEHAADDVAWRLCEQLTDRVARTLGLGGLQAELLLTAAPHWVCLLIAQFEALARRRRIELRETHPDGRARARRIREGQIAAGIPALDLEFVDRSSDLLSELTDF